MKKGELDNFLINLFNKFEIHAPVKVGDKLLIRQVKELKDMDWSGNVPDNTFKELFLPSRESIVDFDKKGNVKEVLENIPKRIVFGVNIMDLEAFSLYEQVFAKDPYYLKRRRNTFVIGYSNGIEDDFRRYKIWHTNFEENILEHRSFDVFVERQKNGSLKVFSGSEKGQKLLEDNGINDYENIEFVGYIPEKGQSPKIKDLYNRVKNSFDKKVWDELNEKCIACGRCTMVCPTCFCFDNVDLHEKDQVVRQRQWSSCFYNNFSEMAGGHEPLDTVKKKIYFWYYHKFVRIPEEFNYTGCVSCMRCFKACPVDINIVKVLSELKKDVTKNKEQKAKSK